MTNDTAKRGRAALLGAAAALALLPAFAAEPGKVPRTSDGQPNLQGYWTNNSVVPLERPAKFADRAELTDEEARDFQAKAVQPEETEAGTDADVHYQLTDFGLDISQNTVVFNKRTSLVVDPPNGRLPPAKPEVVAAGRERAAYNREHAFDGPETRPLGERCILWSHQLPIVPVGYNSNLEIFQSPGYVVIVTEMLPDPRIVPLDSRPHLPSGMKQWVGDSRGHWDGDTLVVESTNFTGKTGMRGLPPGVTFSPQARITERLRRVDADTIEYRFTVEDPTIWDRAWTAEYPMKKIEGPMFEYACQEGNYGMPNTLKGARAAEAAAAKPQSGAAPGPASQPPAR
jgi:hypothetical protein